jgi:hypothetical protein
MTIADFGPLFRDPEEKPAPPFPHGGPYCRREGPDTSRAAQLSMRGKPSNTIRFRILQYFGIRGRDGAVDDEIEIALQLRHTTTSARRLELEEMGVIDRTRDRRQTSSGRYAIVFRINDHGRELLESATP